MSPQRLNIAVIGCGRMGRLHCERVIADGRGRLAALCDVDDSAAHKLKEDLAPDAVVCGRLEQLLNQIRIDAAIVCSPTQLHFEQAAELLDRRIPVLCEKPLARTQTEIQSLIELANDTATVLSIAYQRRTWETYRTLRQLVQSGRFGPVRAVSSHNIENWQQTIAGTWRDDPESNPGGFIGDAGSHKIDAVFFVTGLKPVEVFARTERCGSQVEIVASVSALLEGSVQLTMDLIGNAQHFSETLSIHCALADVTLKEGEIWIGRDARAEQIPLTHSDSNPVAAFLDAVLTGAANFAPPDCALPVYEFTRGVLESARTGGVCSPSPGAVD